MGTCKHCGAASDEIAEVLSLCATCIRERGQDLRLELDEIHAQTRRRFDLPDSPPSSAQGVACGLCQNACRIALGGKGYCGLRRNEDGHLTGGTPQGAAVSWYFDPLPTNCVADWVCGEGSSASHRRRRRTRLNLAVFYEACTFNCLFCQNWHHRKKSRRKRTHTAEELAESVTRETACLCYFGGDPTCQLPHALAVSRLALKKNPNRTLRICWETNGSMDPALLEQMMDLSLRSGGCVKFDLKAANRSIHHALCGVDNTRTMETFAAAAKRIPERPQPPPLIASTLLVPGYIDAREVARIASFVAGLDPNIPYALLGFHGDFLMTDLPSTSWPQAQSCLAAARQAGLTNVRLGNLHILR